MKPERLAEICNEAKDKCGTWGVEAITELRTAIDKSDELIAEIVTAMPDPQKLELLADWFDKYDDSVGPYDGQTREVQSELRRWAGKFRELKELRNENSQVV